MTDCALDVAGIGNAIVDVLAHADDAQLRALGLAKGVMTLIDAQQAEELYSRMGPGLECSGGSAANTIAGIAGLGGRTAFIGKVKADQLGDVFAHDLRSQGVIFSTKPAVNGPSTARCLIFVTPDAQRTMQTYLGACIELGPEDIDADLVANARVTYLEGYLWDPPAAKQAFRKAASIAHAAGRQVALSLSDPYCVERHRDEFRQLLADHVDILFANEAEICSLFQADFDEALRQARSLVAIGAVTRGAAGSVVFDSRNIVEQPAEPVADLVDTTGAGDLYAAGFLYGHSRSLGLAVAARLGGICAAEIISHFGARPAVNLAQRIGDLGLA